MKTVTQKFAKEDRRSSLSSSVKKMKKQEVTQIDIVDLGDDEFFYSPISSRKGTTKATAISVDDYIEDERALNLAIRSSLIESSPNSQLDSLINLDDDIQILNFKPQNTQKQKSPFSASASSSSRGQSSNTKNDPTFICEICVEPKTPNECFKIKGCSHSYCTECMIRYVASKLQENVTSIRCPVTGCRGSLEPEYCRDLLPEDVFQRWGNALCEAVILGAQKFYCPYKDCSALLIDDGGEVVRESECPYCRRMFCAQCKVSWHAGIECAEYQKLNQNEREREDIMLMKLAKGSNWKRCPYCRFYVEKREGCNYMRCRCGASFCYLCGEPYTHLAHCNCSYGPVRLGMAGSVRLGIFRGLMQWRNMKS